ncbi:DUF3108 domain-containing protein [Stenotrophomonas maltophilia]|nr:DUF3108 domain-containing protein [Stenotrophomonas maltophilia]
MDRCSRTVGGQPAGHGPAAIQGRLPGQLHGHAGQWQHDAEQRGSQQVALHAAGEEPAGDLSQSTVFEEVRGQLRPLSSQDRSALLVKKRNVQANYNWTSNQATWTGDIKPDRAGPIALKTGDMDALLINLTIARDLAAGKPLTYRMVDEGRIKNMTYRVIGKESITVGGKSYEATKVSRADGNKELIAWIVPEFPVPARMLQRESGRDALDLTIKAMN